MEPYQKKLVLIVGIFFGLIAVVSIIIAIVSNPPEVKTGVRFVVAPDEIVVTGGEKDLKVIYDQVVTFKPGEYTLTLKRDNFKETTKKVTVKEGEVSQLYALLEASNEAGEKTLKEEIYRSRIERISGFNVTEGGAELSKKYPFIDKLPLTGKFYYAFPCIINAQEKEYGVCIKLALQEDFYKNQALDALRTAGIDPTTVFIEYR